MRNANTIAADLLIPEKNDVFLQLGDIAFMAWNINSVRLYFINLLVVTAYFCAVNQSVLIEQ